MESTAKAKIARLLVTSANVIFIEVSKTAAAIESVAALFLAFYASISGIDQHLDNTIFYWIL
jgi:hypothetical protein|tara:strand:+ start:80 stop:265 length:186 start_codon:yes stop_codon:yes gene_type:complete